MMLETLVLAMFAIIQPGAERVVDRRIVAAIAEAGRDATEEEVALLTTYAWLESAGRVNPKAWSWDARAGVSCGPWQEPCGAVRQLSLVGQANFWLRELRTSGLASLDSNAKRAEKRLAMAKNALSRARSN
jgi:hypothetical protein